MQCDCKNGNSEISFFIIRSIFLLSVFLRGLQQYNRFNLKSSLRGEAVIFRKRHRKRTLFIFPVEPFDLSLKDVFLIVGDMLNLALGSLRSAKLLKFKQKRGCLKMIFQNHMRQPLFSSIHQEKRRILRQKQYTKSEGVVFVPLIWCTVVFFICYAASRANR